jgi:uncharacterized membrane protein
VPNLVETVKGAAAFEKDTEGLVFGIGATAKQLAVHFPYDPTQDVNELPDDVDVS